MTVLLESYYRRHIRSFAEIARPPHELTKIHARFDWGPRQEDSFLSLKYSLTNAPVLAMPLDGGGFVLDTDANQFSMCKVFMLLTSDVVTVVRPLFIFKFNILKILSRSTRVRKKC